MPKVSVEKERSCNRIVLLYLSIYQGAVNVRKVVIGLTFLVDESPSEVVMVDLILHW